MPSGRFQEVKEHKESKVRGEGAEGVQGDCFKKKEPEELRGLRRLFNNRPP
jgi:hypothetical protein